jgi:serine/threonine protein kinase
MQEEYGLRSELDPGFVVRPLALVQAQRRPMLVLEDPGGLPLDPFLHGPMETRHFLRLAISVAAALGHVHSRGLIHKDVKPANILVNTARDRAWLTGLGIASRLRRERQSPQPPEFAAGTLAYMAPEQTGRMNRSIDSRSDLYSLGVTFYQMLTGSLPFTASYRKKTDTSRAEVKECPGCPLSDRHEVARKDGRGALPDCRRR